MMAAPSSRSGAVVIGRNEGDRLRACIESVLPSFRTTVYVDSGSTDGSIPLARSMEVEVVELDMDRPFTAARARNAGFERLKEIKPELAYVQFVDGDCEIVPGWPAAAEAALEQDPTTAVVCGRRRERFREATIYNRLCDMEWDTPVGSARSCGGDALMRASAFEEVGGFSPGQIAGEEPELCFRMRQKGWTVVRLDCEMTRHDSAMTRFWQWWQRSRRAGHAYAQNAFLHGSAPERFNRREVRSVVFWGLALPVVSVTGFLWSPALGALVALYPLLAFRIFLRRRRKEAKAGDAALYGLFCVLAKFSGALGVLAFHRGRITGKSSLIIEYK